MGFSDWFSPPKPAPVVIIRNVLARRLIALKVCVISGAVLICAAETGATRN